MTSLVELMGIGNDNVELLSSNYDHWFRYHDSTETEVDEVGDQDVFPHGHATLRFVSDDYLAEHPSLSVYLPTAGWYIDVRDSNGFVFVFDYLGTGTLPEERARAAFARYTKAYDEWAAEYDANEMLSHRSARPLD